MAGRDDELPRRTSEIVAWLGEDDGVSDRVDGIRGWHGDAALVAALESVAALPMVLRGPAFFARIREIKQARKVRGDWPTMKSEEWGTR